MVKEDGSNYKFVRAQERMNTGAKCCEKKNDYIDNYRYYQQQEKNNKKDNNKKSIII